MKQAMELLSERELSEFLKVNLETVRRWRREGLVSAYRIGGGTIRYNKAEAIEQLLKPA